MTILDILKKHGLYSKTNKDWYICHCANPEHEDKNPSMVVHKNSGYFQCFACGIKGNFNKLLTLLNEPLVPIYSDQVVDNKNRLLDLLSSKLSQSLNHIPQDAITPTFSFRGLTKELYEEFKIFLSKEYPNRLNIPLFYKGKVYAIISRTLIDEQPKYIVTKFSEYLYPFSLDRISGSYVYLVEGIFDYFAMYKAGIANTLCTFGLSNRYIVKKMLIEYGIRDVYILFDGDDAGINGAYAMKNYLNSSFNKVEIIHLPFNIDPDSCENLQYYLTFREA